MQRGGQPHGGAAAPLPGSAFVPLRRPLPHGDQHAAAQHAAATAAMDTLADAGAESDGGAGGGGGTTVKYVAELVNSPAELSEIKNPADLEVARLAFLRACEDCPDALELTVNFLRDRYVLVVSGYAERFELAYLERISAINNEPRFERYKPIEKIWIDFDAGVINIEVRKIECSNQVVLQQMLLVDRDAASSDAAAWGGGGGGGHRGARGHRTSRAAADDDDDGDDSAGYGARGRHGAPYRRGRSRSRSRSPPRRNAVVRMVTSLFGASD